MSDDIDEPEWDPPELPDRDAPKIYVAGPGRIQQFMRTLSAVVAAAAIVWGVLWLGDESTKQTDLMEQQIVYNECKDHLMATFASRQVLVGALGENGATNEWIEREHQWMKDGLSDCFPADGIIGDE